jgi:hypothetical protein
MEKQQPILKWLALAALIEWLILRTATRAAIHMPKPAAFAAVYQAINTVGLVAASLVGLLALLALGWIAWQEWRTRQAVILPLLLLTRAALSLLFLVILPAGWIVVFSYLLTLAILGLLLAPTLYGHRRPAADGVREGGQALVLLPPALALLGGVLYQALPAFYSTAGLPGPAPLTGLLFNLGELFVIVTAGTLWWVYGRSASVRHGVIAALPALLFALSFWRDPAMTGILTIWSTGLTLFLPWPFYPVALWLVGVTLMANWRHKPPVAYAILLLAAAGYAPQLSSQLFCALTALWLLVRSVPVRELNRQMVYTHADGPVSKTSAPVAAPGSGAVLPPTVTSGAGARLPLPTRAGTGHGRGCGGSAIGHGYKPRHTSLIEPAGSHCADHDNGHAYARRHATAAHRLYAGATYAGAHSRCRRNSLRHLSAPGEHSRDAPGAAARRSPT